MRLLVFVLLAALGLCACRQPRTTSDLVADLRNPSPQERRRAADGLRTDDGVPAEAIGPLLQAVQVERDRGAFGAMMITLGRSGVPEAKPLIDARIPEPDPDMRRWAARALKYWLIANRQLPPDPQLPDGWPYGQPGFPPPLPAD
jgi:HEAT repeat protein